MALPAPPTPATAGRAALSGWATRPAARRWALLSLAREHHPLRPRPEGAQLPAGLPSLRASRNSSIGSPYEPAPSLIPPPGSRREAIGLRRSAAAECSRSSRDQVGVGAGQCVGQLAAGKDVELDENVAQMPLNGPRAEEEPPTALGI